MSFKNCTRRLGLTALTVLTLALSAQSGAAGPVAFASDLSRKFGTVDLASGTFTQLGASTDLFAGMAYFGGTLYASSYLAGGQLYSVGTASGSISPIGSASAFSYVNFGSTASGLFALDTNSNLLSINPITGAAALLGATGLNIQVGAVPSSLSNNSQTLYATNGTSFYSLNVATGAPTLIGSTGTVRVSAMTEIDGQLYGGVDTPAIGIAIINKSTGTATFVGGTAGLTNGFYALAAVPEPSTVLMFVSGGLLLTAFGRRYKTR